MAKINIILVGRNEVEIIIQFKDLIILRGAHLINIVSNYKDADMEVDITNFTGITNMENEVNYILNASIVRRKYEKKHRKIIKKQSIKINKTIKEINEATRQY